MRKFAIKLNGNGYIVTQAMCSTANGMKECFKIETDCDYLFTITLNEDLKWEIADNKLTAIDDGLVQDIGLSLSAKLHERSY